MSGEPAGGPEDEAVDLFAYARAALTTPRPHDLTTVAAASGMAPDDLARLFTAARRTSADDTYSDADIAYARDLAMLVGRSSVEIVESVLRARIRAITQLAISDLATVPLDRDGRGLVHGEDPEGLARLLGELAVEVIPAVERLMVADYRVALRTLVDSDVVARIATDVDTLPTMAVGFVDLVGFTRLSAATDPAGVGTVLTAFERLATETADVAGPSVRVAKTIGDAVMIVGGDTDEVAHALLHIVADQPDDLLDVQRRAGMAWGEVLVRDGDFVGTTVNTAARLTDLARPGAVVVSEDAADTLTGDWNTSRLPPTRLRGLGTSRPVRLRPAAQPS